MAKIKLKPKARKGLIDIKALIKHPMETGERKNKKTGKNYPANYITDLSVSVNGTEVAVGLIGYTVSKNPYFRLKAPGSKGDKVTLSYKDNKGKSDTSSKNAK